MVALKIPCLMCTTAHFTRVVKLLQLALHKVAPLPCFLEECVYNMLVDGDVDINTLVTETHLTTHEQEVLESIKIIQ